MGCRGNIVSLCSYRRVRLVKLRHRMPAQPALGSGHDKISLHSIIKKIFYAYVYDTKQFKLLPNDMGGKGKVAPRIKTNDLAVLPLLPPIISHPHCPLKDNKSFTCYLPLHAPFHSSRILEKTFMLMFMILNNLASLEL